MGGSWRGISGRRGLARQCAIAIATLALSGCSFHTEPLLPAGTKSFPSASDGDHGTLPPADGGAAGLDASPASAGGDGRDAATPAHDATVAVPDAGTHDPNAAPDASGSQDAGSAPPDAQIEDARVADATAADAGGDPAPDAEPIDSGSPCPCVCPHALIDQPAPDPGSSCRPAVCAIDACAPEPGCRLAVYESSGYYICDTVGSWHDVTQHCASVPGAYLVEIESAGEDDFLFGELNDKTWIGASDLVEEGVFRWNTGTEFWRGGSPVISGGGGPGPGGGSDPGGAAVRGKYANFLSYEPDSRGVESTDADCVLLWPDQDGWADATCGDDHGYVCEFPLPLAPLAQTGPLNP